MRILLVEDDELVADAVARGLSLAGFTVDHATSTEHARLAIAGEHFDLAVVDIGLPGEDGIALLRDLRSAERTIPVIMLTARYELADKLRAFELGADDFLRKPFEQAELAARCKALIRRFYQIPAGALRLGKLSVDLAGRRLLVNECAIDLTRREWAVLDSLVHNMGRVVSKERLQQALAGWEQDLTANAIETQVSRLRNKLGPSVVIRTIRGLGYRIEEAQDPEQ